MDEQSIPGNGKLNLIELGLQLNITSIGAEMRMLNCPACKKKDIVKRDTKYVVCTCGLKIKMQERWYED